MRLEELLFCVSFFLIPVLGTLAVAMRRALLTRHDLEGESEEVFNRMASKEKLYLNRREKGFPMAAFVGTGKMEYQLLESQIHMPLILRQLKDRTHPRAGP